MSVRQSGEWMGLDGFVWFFGVVEDRMDPLKVGRVRVRCYGWHTDNITQVPTESLPWAQVVQSPNSAAMGDIGYTPMGLVEGTLVMGFFLDGKNAQLPMILGSIAGIPLELGELMKNSGFSDPSGVYPNRINEPDVNRLSRADAEYQHELINAVQIAQANTGEVSVARSSFAWSLPVSNTLNSIYPKNHVYQSESGHIRETDDTPRNRRIREYHASGTYYEIDNVGNKTSYIVANTYTVVANNSHVKIMGDCNLTVEGTLRIKTDAMDIETNTYSLNIAGESIFNYGGDTYSRTGANTYSTRETGTDHTVENQPTRNTDTWDGSLPL